MKKYIVFAVCFLLISIAAQAQMPKDSLMKIMAKETCTEISKKDLAGKSMDELEMELGLAMLPVVAKYQEELKTIFGFDMEDPKSMEGMGREVGMQLAKDCPAFLKMFMSNPEAMKEITGKDKNVPAVSIINGTLLKVVNGDFTYIQVKDGSGKIEKLWWMEYFEGSNKLINELDKQLNKPVRVSYIEKEIYNSTLKDYMKLKIITGMD